MQRVHFHAVRHGVVKMQRLHLNSGTAEQTSIDLYSCLFDECTVARPVGGLAAYELGGGQREDGATVLRRRKTSPPSSPTISTSVGEPSAWLTSLFIRSMTEGLTPAGAYRPNVVSASTLVPSSASGAISG